MLCYINSVIWYLRQSKVVPLSNLVKFMFLIFFQVQLDPQLIGKDFLDTDTNLTGLYCIERGFCNCPGRFYVKVLEVLFKKFAGL